LHKGFAPVTSLPTLLRGAHLGVVANREDGFMEYTLPTKLMEYVAMGIPSVVPRTNAIIGYFDDKQVGFFTPGEPKGLAEQIVRLASNPVLAQQMADAAYKFYDEHNWAATRRRFVNLAMRPKKRPVYHLLKRVIDFMIAVVALAILALPMAVIALAIKLKSPGPVLFRQERIGKDGKPFTIYKFRTMHLNTDPEWHKKFTEELMKKAAEGGKQAEWLPPKEDPRVYKLGKILRKTGLDEIPQLFNVVQGNMSLVGPRPPIGYEVERYTDWQNLRLTVMPGITGLWQVEGRGATTFDDMVALDVEYMERANLFLDLYLIAATVPARLLASRKYGR
jgi:lipopolysaccharide/colanic/teichoic acid biosynthesis glycosyltransferase